LWSSPLFSSKKTMETFSFSLIGKNCSTIKDYIQCWQIIISKSRKRKDESLKKTWIIVVISRRETTSTVNPCHYHSFRVVSERFEQHTLIQSLFSKEDVSSSTWGDTRLSLQWVLLAIEKTTNEETLLSSCHLLCRRHGNVCQAKLRVMSRDALLLNTWSCKAFDWRVGGSDRERFFINESFLFWILMWTTVSPLIHVWKQKKKTDWQRQKG
jgi:hypothetical protein